MQRSFHLSSCLLGIALLSLLVVRPLTTAAEEPSTGRLPDGRAYRTDDQGVQLIDYIAELEVSNQALDEQVRGLEGELKERNAVIAELKNRGQVTKPLRESDLVGSGSKRETDRESVDRDLVAKCREELARITHTLTEERLQAEQSFAEYQGTITTLRARLESPQCPAPDCAPQVRPIEARVTALTEELETLRESRERELGEAQARVVALETKLAHSSAELTKVTARLAATAERASPGLEEQPVVARVKNDAQSDLARVLPREEGSARASLDRDALAPGVVRASRRPSEEARPASLTLREGTPQLSSARERAVQSLRGGLLSELNQSRGWVERRDAQFAKFNQKKRAIAFKPARAVSSKGRTLSEIADAAKSARSVYELTQLRREMIEIRARMTDDMGLMTRIN